MFYRAAGWEDIYFLAVAIEKYMRIQKKKKKEKYMRKFMTLFPSKDGI